MGKIAFVFSGQGDQFPGMGKELYEKSANARKVFDLCEAIRPGTLDQCFSGTETELRETKNTQPCLFAMELAAVAALEEKNICPMAAAGFSLGELAAATVSGLFSLETGFSLVCKRGELMQAVAETVDTAMAAVVKLPSSTLEAICGEFDGVYPVNYNCPGQITVSGLSDRMPEFALAVKAAGGRAIPLKVKGGFHSPFMKGAAEGFGALLAHAEFGKRRIPLYSNVTARPYEENPAELLSRQIASPVRWEETVRNLMADGFDTFVEIGPGKTLTNMIRKIDASVNLSSYSELLTEESTC